jgi:hypothetical protein
MTSATTRTTTMPKTTTSKKKTNSVRACQAPAPSCGRLFYL